MLWRLVSSIVLCLGATASCSGDAAEDAPIRPAEENGAETDAGTTTKPSDSPERPARDADGGAEPSPPASGDCPTDATYEGFARPFFEENCNLCHSATRLGDSRLGAPDDANFDTEDDIVQQAAVIEVVVLVEQTMPVGFVLDDCDFAQLERYLTTLDAPPCEPMCAGKRCGTDGCGGTCGACPLGETCDAANGSCEAVACMPNCSGKACGDDGCGNSCGDCSADQSCSEAQQCVCTPRCDGKVCGDDGCGGSCGECAGNEVCDAEAQCVCIPDCSGKVCGDDGCGGTCGTCPTSSPDCASDGTLCECVPDCTGKNCGDDGCGGSCGTCHGRTCNTREGRCVVMCTADCSGRVCGDDGCEGSCGTCEGTDACDPLGMCVCEPDCLGKSCGPDGCGGTCGQCSDGSVCSEDGHCACTPNCDGRSCGSDGCGGECGNCGEGESCSDGSCVAFCAPNCSGKQCGDDGCGGSCGSCASGTSCVSGQCDWPATSFESDVFPILSASGCADGACHDAARPADGLDLSSAQVAFDALVGVPSTQCSDRLLVNPSAPDSSYLVHKIIGEQLCSGSKMPKSGAGLSAADIETLRAWIGGGALP